MKNKLSANVIMSFGFQLVTIIVGFIVPRLIISNYGSETNGLINSITQFLGYITLLDIGIGPVIKSILYKPINENDDKTIINIIGASERFFRKIAVIFIVYIIFLSFVFNSIINTSFNSWYTVSLIIIIGISTFFEYFFGLSYSLFLQADKKSYIINEVKIITTIINAVLVVLLIKYGFTIQVVKLVSSTVFVMRPLFLKFYVHKKYKFNFKNIDNSYVIEHKGVAVTEHIAGIIHGKTDAMVLSVFQNQMLVSVYSVYNLITNGVQGIITTISASLDAYFGNIIAQKDIEKLNKYFSIYEIIFFIIVTILYSVTMITIVPFVKIYTNGIFDINYIHPTFAVLIVTAYYFLALKVPYNALAYASGNFKDIRFGSIMEAVLNLCISIIFVQKYGLIGVAIGTLVSVMFRFIDLVRYTRKKILTTPIWESIKKIILNVMCFIIIYFTSNFFDFTCESYLTWFIYALLIGIVTTIIVFMVNFVFFHKEILNFIKEWKSR